MALLNFDLPIFPTLMGLTAFSRRTGIDLAECYDSPKSMSTFRKIFERKIRYWDIRPMTRDERVVVSPSDSKVLLGSFRDSSALFIKEKFFSFAELLGEDRPAWLQAFRGGDFAIFRLTPEKYHYNHAPVSGRVEDFYEIPGIYHSCNPGAVVCIPNPYSKNKRVVTIIQTDTKGGTGAGLVAMIEVAALMIGDIVQAYSEQKYDTPRAISQGMLVRCGQPKSLFRPGSSTVILIFQQGKVEFFPDLLSNRSDAAAQSRYRGYGASTQLETEVRVRSSIARAIRDYTNEGSGCDR
jgi:phosphatidylserine decarboxylase